MKTKSVSNLSKPNALSILSIKELKKIKGGNSESPGIVIGEIVID